MERGGLQSKGQKNIQRRDLMMKKLFVFASAAVFSFGMAVASTEVAAPVVSNQEMVTALVDARKVVAEMSAQEIEAIVQELKRDGTANNETVAALWEQAQGLVGFEIGSITLGMIAVVAVAYYGLPLVYNRALKPAGEWVSGKCRDAKAARAEKRRLAAAALAHKDQ